MCRILQAHTFVASHSVVENAHRALQNMCKIFDPNDEFNFADGDLCPDYIQCMQPALAEFFPPGSFLTKVSLSKDEISYGADEREECGVGDKKFTLGERTVMHCLMEVVMHEHQTDDGALWEFGEALLHYVIHNVYCSQERALLAEFMWNMMDHN